MYVQAEAQLFSSSDVACSICGKDAAIHVRLAAGLGIIQSLSGRRVGCIVGTCLMLTGLQLALVKFTPQ